jgi:CRISPR-associated protein Csd1
MDNKGAPPMSLDTSNADPGYLLGRLFSVLENIQRAALGKQINATIRDRYYGAASATPASVMPVLLRNAQHHLGRLRKDKPGYAVVLEKEIGEIIDLLGTAFPKSLGIEAQGHFAIGYYHQTKARFAGKDAQEENDTNDLEGEIQ